MTFFTGHPLDSLGASLLPGYDPTSRSLPSAALPSAALRTSRTSGRTGQRANGPTGERGNGPTGTRANVFPASVH